MLSIITSSKQSAPPASFNLAAYVLANATRLADKTALEIVGDTPTRISYRQLQASVLGAATGLQQQGLAAGDRVLLQMGNTPDFPIAYLAAIAIGVIPVPLSAQLTEPELEKIAAVIKPAMTVHETGFRVNGLPTLASANMRSFYSLTPANYVMGDPDRPAYIVFTSGTSGQPRAVVHAHRAIWARRMMWDGWYGLRENDRLMHAGAFNWTYTLGTGLMDPWSVGATALIPADGTQSRELAKRLSQSNATLFAASPGVIRKMMRGDVPPLPKLRHGLSAGEKLSTRDRAAWMSQTGTNIHEAFGMSECSTFISGNPSRATREDASGFVQEGRNVAILGANGPVPRGQIGTIAVRRDDAGLMLGYLDQPAETEARYNGEWFVTGDQAIMDDEGAITFVGRNDDMMNAGGHRVSPIEVEDALLAHPDISEIAACAVQIRTGVFVIAGFYVSQTMIDQDELRSFANERLAAYKTPRLYIACDALPRGANNKLLRQKLRTDWEAAHGQA